MFAPPTPPLVSTPTAKGSGGGIGSRVPGEPREPGEPVPAPEHPAPAPDKNED
ncbi:hypothetical protein GCM10009602_20610 [Nocardiopsis tropica]